MLGYDVGIVDGIVGNKTRSQYEAYKNFETGLKEMLDNIHSNMNEAFIASQ